MPFNMEDANKVRWLGLVLGALFWLGDALVDTVFFNPGVSYRQAFLAPQPMELYMRLVVVLLLPAFAFYAAYLLERAARIEQQLRASNDQLETLRQDLEQQSVIDTLTGCFNRRKFVRRLDEAIAHAERHQHLFALLMIDVDHFKQVNDEYGHHAGDRVLQGVCDGVRSVVRSTDQLFRLGGDEFALLAMISGSHDAEILAEKIRQAVASHDFQEVSGVTVSLGVACFRQFDTDEKLYVRADAALYEAKRNGRNCIGNDEGEVIKSGQ